MADSTEMRMINGKLKNQNELLLSQLESALAKHSIASIRIDADSSVKSGTRLSSEIPYTLNREALFLLSGEEDLGSLGMSSSIHHKRLLDFFALYDPERMQEVDDLLRSYKGVEETLFESLQIKYGYNSTGSS